MGRGRPKSLVCGVGINDADYSIGSKFNGKLGICPFYKVWASMLKRCYCKKWQEKYPTYIGCSVSQDWLTFSNFKRWMETKDFHEKQLDKDLLFSGNKVYSAETCVFVDLITNCFTKENDSARGDWPLGVCLHRQTGKFTAQCNDPFSKRRGYLGLFSCQNQAHLAWRKRKHELACMLAELQTDHRAADALRTKYL